MGKSSQQYNIAKEHQRSLHGVYGSPSNAKEENYAFGRHDDDDSSVHTAQSSTRPGWFQNRGAATNNGVLLTWLLFTLVSTVGTLAVAARARPFFGGLTFCARFS